MFIPPTPLQVEFFSNHMLLLMVAFTSDLQNEGESSEMNKKKNTHTLTLCLLVSSADNLSNRLDTDQARQDVGPDLDPNCLTL